MVRKMLVCGAAAVALLAASPALAQVTSGGQRVQGVGDANRGDPVNVRRVTCSGGTCTEETAVTVAGTTLDSTATFTTPSGTTNYTSGMLIANSATAGSVTPFAITACRVNGGSGMIRRLRVKTPDTGFAAATVIIYLYKTAPTVTNGDHATWLSTESNYLGGVSVTLDKHFSDYEKGIGVPISGSEINYTCAAGSTSIYGLEVAGSTITPQGAKVHSITAEILAN